MSGVGSQFHTDLQKLSATHLNAGGRHSGNALQLILGFLAFDDSGAVSATGRMLGGLAATPTGGTLNMVMTEGVAAFKHANPTGLTAVIDTFESIPTTVVAVVDGSTLVFTANASGSTRIDYIVVDWSLFTDRNLSMPQKTGPPVLQDTRHAPRGVLSILVGTPAAGDPTPSATQQALYRVEMPDGTNAANFDTDAIIKELSQNVTFNGLGPGHGAYRRRGYPDTEEISLIEALARDEGTAGFRYRWEDDGAPDRNLDFYHSFRRAGLPSGEAGADLFPLVNPGGREYTLFIPFGSGAIRNIVDNSDIAVADEGSQVSISRIAGSLAETFEFTAVVPLPGRGLQLIDGTFYWDVDTAFDGVISIQAFDFAVATQTGGFTSLSGLPSPALGVLGSGKTANFTPTGEPVVVEGEFLRISLLVGLDATGTVGEVTLRGMKLKVREGRV